MILGLFVCNFGDMFECMIGGFYCSMLYWVVCNILGCDCLLFLLFFDLNFYVCV